MSPAPRQTAVLALTGACVLVACAGRRDVTGDRVSLALDSFAERQISLRDVRIEPADNVASARLDARGVIAIERVDQTRALQITAPDMCPVRVPPGPQPDALGFQNALSLGGDRTGIGYGAHFSVQARFNCADLARAGEIRWQQLEGPALAELQVSDAGFVLSARTVSFADAHSSERAEVERAHGGSGPVEPSTITRNLRSSTAIPPAATSAGIVPISPRTQGRVVLEARWTGPGFLPAKRRLVISAAARATGLSSVAVSQPLVLSGADWSVKMRPPGGHASVKASEGLSFFTADAPGSWTLAQADGHTLKLQSLTHDATPYDCGRAECHAALAEHTARSAMSRALERPLEAGAEPAAVSCMLDCHVLGERGLSDGGFQAVAARLGFTWTEHTRWQDLPQALRRAGGVRCTACHGPGAIPPPEQRSAILASDVCATCHDAPPRYVHVTQWRTSRMALSDRDRETRQAPCARCHTTAGFLAHSGVRKLSDEAPRSEPVGIACAACHAPHSENRGPHLIRNVAMAETQAGELFPEPATNLCRSCHAPLAPPRTLLPSGADEPASQRSARAEQREPPAGVAAKQADGFVAPSGSLFASEIRVPARDGAGWEHVRSRSVHAQVPRGCIGCHGGGALQSAALDHSFRAEPRVCATCHADDAMQAGRVANDALHARALALSQVLAPHCQSDATRSAHPQLAAARCSDSLLERARYETNLVLDDNAALFHNADLSRALLEDAEQIVSSFRRL